MISNKHLDTVAAILSDSKTVLEVMGALAVYYEGIKPRFNKAKFYAASQAGKKGKKVEPRFTHYTDTK